MRTLAGERCQLVWACVRSTDTLLSLGPQWDGFFGAVQKKFWPARFPFMFCLLSWATVIGFLRCITGRQTVHWAKAGSPAVR